MYSKITPKEIKNNLMNICKSRGMTLSKLAYETGVSISTIYKWDTIYPNLLKLMRIADYFNIRVDDILIRDKASEVVQKFTKQFSNTYIIEELSKNESL